MRKIILEEIEESIKTKQSVLNSAHISDSVEKVCLKIIECYKNGGKVIFAGNGGSAADAQHLAAELVSRFYYDRPGLASLALTTDTSIITAIGNDYGYEKLFARQLQANANAHDIFIAITTSGNSVNIVNGLRYAKENNIFSVCLNGKNGGIITKEGLADIDIIIPSSSTPRIQEAQLMIGHIICAIVEKEMFPCKQ